MKKVRIFSTNQMKVNITSSIDISQDQSYLAAVTRYRPENTSQFYYQIQTFDLQNLKPLNTTFIYSTYNENTHPCKILSNGNTIIVVSLNHLYFYNRDLTLKNKMLHHQIDVYDLQASPDSRLFAIVGNQKIVIWDTETYKEIIFPRVSFLTKKCKFSNDNQYFGIISESSLNLYKIKTIGDTFTFDLVETTQNMGEEQRLQVLRLGSFNTFQFNPYNSMEVVIGFGNSSPKIYSFDTKQFQKVATQEQPFQMDNFKSARYLPDGKRVVSSDHLKGVGYWPGSQDKSLVYKENYLLFGISPFNGGRKLVGFVWQKIKFAEIQFQCTPGNFSTSCQCAPNQYFDMSAQMCKPCSLGENNNICQCNANETFNPDVGACVYDCSKDKNAVLNPYSRDRNIPCYCKRGYIWKNGKCSFDCTQIFFAAEAGPTPQSCTCFPGYSWNNIGKYCQCPLNSRLVSDTGQDGTISCDCLYNYVLDPVTGVCKPDCTKIRFTNGTDQNGNCQCVDGFLFQIYQNSSAIDSQQQVVNKAILSASTAACIKNCSALKNTEGVKFFDQCQCQESMIWNGERCGLNCRKIKNAVELVTDINNTQLCTCTLNYNWVPQNRQCGRNCQNFNYVNKSKYATTLSCPCISNFNWNSEPINQCVIDCTKINFTESYSVNSNAECICRQLFQWNKDKLKCVLNCSQIWDADQLVGDSQCSCKQNKQFNKTSMTCQVLDSQGVFNKPWVWAILGVFLLFVLIVAIVMIRYCWKFANTDQNKQHNKKLKKNMQPKLKKKDQGDPKVLPSERAQLIKQKTIR